eukprot:gnl/TRDRNA2_/TRDRNA2_29841_c0_seq1.p1 gnl/TRDRNA2_/TRDRNA2_29841_c0~~gnl/TRDRNA2_/TRDRNA2_29841_c0_seq1.p1  ORF type:complete len:339 (+),score=19.03 gnl/TRDRNA2_/TRDRNA2_29841_c0_seq1:67-1083(+)
MLRDSFDVSDDPQGEKEEEEAPLGGWECAICYDLLCDPVRLPCKHTFCRCCIAKTFQLARQRHGVPPGCPLCRAELPPGFNAATAAGATGLLRMMRRIFPIECRRREAEFSNIGELPTGQWMLVRIGNRYETIANPQKSANKHCWTMFVEPVVEGSAQETPRHEHAGKWLKARTELSRHVKSVKFQLRPYFPSDVELRTAPFIATRIGWGYFDVAVTITWKPALRTSPFQVDHELCFERGGSSEVHEVFFETALPPAARAHPLPLSTSQSSSLASSRTPRAQERTPRARVSQAEEHAQRVIQSSASESPRTQGRPPLAPLLPQAPRTPRVSQTPRRVP